MSDAYDLHAAQPRMFSHEAEARLDERVRAAAIVLGRQRGLIPFTVEGHEKFLTDIAKEILAPKEPHHG